MAGGEEEEACGHLPDGYADFVDEGADGGDPAARLAAPHAGAVGGLHVTELTQLLGPQQTHRRL